MTPSELKKLKNKRRKAQKKLEKEKEKQKLEQEKKEHTGGKKQQEQELDGPKEEDLIPEKLAKVSTNSKTYVWNGYFQKRPEIGFQVLK